MDRETFYRTTVDLLGRLNSRPDEPVVLDDVTEDDNLFDEGLLTSFSVAQVMGYIEERSGHQIDAARYGIEDFSSLRRLYAVFEQQQDTAAVA